MITPTGQNDYIHKIKILGIAPYEGMKTIMQKLAETREDMELDVFVGDLNEGAMIARNNLHSDYDVIISRGGTAELIGQVTHIPVIEVTLSVYDILRAIKLAENYADRYAIVGFPAITKNAHLLCDLLQYKIDIFTIHSQEEVRKTLKDLKKKGYRMVLCDMIANTTAKKLGLNAILITSGNESILAAFDQAVGLCASYAAIKAEKLLLEDIIRYAPSRTVILKEDGSLFFTTAEGGDSSMIQMLRKELPHVLNNETHKFFKNIDSALYSFTGHRLTFLNENYAAFYFSAGAVPFATSKYGIQYSNQQEAKDDFFNSFYDISGSESSNQTTIETLNQLSAPVMLSGEPGSGKEQTARMIYSQSALKQNPLITINCALINDRSWTFITNHYNSPFNDNNNTKYLKDITVLPEGRRRHLLSIIVDTNLCKRNRVLFSAACLPGQTLPPEAMEFVNQLSCVTLYMPPLRQRAEDLPALSSLYLNSLNVSMVNQIIGFEPDAMALLQQFDWPYNYTQFKRILSELALVTTTPYITAEHVAQVLKKESDPAVSASRAGVSSINLNRTLDEITHDVIRQVLAENGGNQSAAAKQLGISRTTLWRYMK